MGEPPAAPLERSQLPWYLRVIPARLERWARRHLWWIILINLMGTAFGFWYYGVRLWPPGVTWQLGREPLVMWPFVPDSPLATLLFAVALIGVQRGAARPTVVALGFIGSVKLGLWTPFVLVAFSEAFLATTATAMYLFLLVSHLGMAVQALLLARLAEFRVRGVVIAVGWYLLNDIVDYFLPIIGSPHHTALPLADATPIYGATVLQVAAAGAVSITVLATVLAFVILLRQRAVSAGV